MSKSWINRCKIPSSTRELYESSTPSKVYLSLGVHSLYFKIYVPTTIGSLGNSSNFYILSESWIVWNRYSSETLRFASYFEGYLIFKLSQKGLHIDIYSILLIVGFTSYDSTHNGTCCCKLPSTCESTEDISNPSSSDNTLYFAARGGGSGISWIIGWRVFEASIAVYSQVTLCWSG
jgi:hypothetical protein